MITKVSIVLSIVWERIKNWDLTLELIEFLEFVRIVCIYNQEIIRFSV